MTAVAEILEAALKLDEKERAQLLEELSASLHGIDLGEKGALLVEMVDYARGAVSESARNRMGDEWETEVRAAEELEEAAEWYESEQGGASPSSCTRIHALELR